MAAALGSTRSTGWRDPATGRVPTLDGLRAISILAVVVGHVAGTAGFPAVATSVIANRYLDVAYLGVRVFFVISGFLITGILMEAAGRSGGISLRRFYLRRTMRIFPAYYAYLVALVILTAVGIASITGNDLVRAVTYTINYDNDRSWDVGHLWSLAVEEQFYLLWPLALVLAGIGRGIWIAVGVVLLAPLFRVIEYLFVPELKPLIGNTFETTADAIAMGAILALALDRLVDRAWFVRLIRSSWMIPAVLLAGLALNIRSDTGVILGVSLTNLGVALLVARCVLLPDGWAGRLLETRPLIVIGVLSYSIYLWQQLFLDRTSDALIASFPLNLVLVAACAVGSYLLIERPFLWLRPRLEARWLGGARQPSGRVVAPPAPVPNAAPVPVEPGGPADSTVGTTTGA
jgi:peptidoglycan/LPS O-acetylase OafA/YrhL